MERVNNIINNPIYRSHYEAIIEAEVNRIYCHHDMCHFMDVARIAMILSYEEGISVDKEQVYAAALLHDIGRDVQYLSGVMHELASAEIAPGILRESGFTKEEIDVINEAIREHGNEETAKRKDLAGIIYRADKLSRKCFDCNATDTCHKATAKRNMEIKI